MYANILGAVAAKTAHPAVKGEPVRLRTSNG
jgi:hypothetical protein